MAVLDLPGPQFLGFYILALAVSVVVGLVARATLRSAAGSVVPARFEPDPFEAAYLHGGVRGVAGAAIAALVQRGGARVDKSDGTVRPVSPLPRGASLVEVDAHHAMLAGHHKTARIAAALAGGTTARVVDKLRGLGLVPTPGQAAATRFVPAVPVLLLGALGLAKVSVGMDRGKPVVFLGVFLVFTAVIALIFLLRSTRTTTAGRKVLKGLQVREAALRATAGSPAGPTLAPADAAMAMALFGPTVFMVGPLADVRRAVSPRDSGGSCGGGGSSCGSGGGGGGGGCGGCGGGGD